MIEGRMAASRGECLAFREKVSKESLTVTDRVGGEMCFFQGRSTRHVPQAPCVAPKVPQRDPEARLARKPSVTLSIKHPHPQRGDRYLHQIAKSSAGAGTGRSLLEERYAKLPMYSSFSPTTEFHLPPLPKLTQPPAPQV